MVTRMKKITTLLFCGTLLMFAYAKPGPTYSNNGSVKSKSPAAKSGNLMALNVSVDAPHFANGTIGDYVWRDINGDGLNNEPAAAGINGVTVELYKETAPGSNTYSLQASMATANDASGNPGYYLFSITTSGNYKVKFPLMTEGAALTNQTATPATDNNSDANTTDGFSPAFAINTAGTGISLDNITIDAGYHCANGITTSNFTVIVGSSVAFGQGLVYTAAPNNCGGGGSTTIQIPINIPVSAVDNGTNPVPLGTATMSALPANAIVTSAQFTIPRIQPAAFSLGSEVRIALSGAITKAAAAGNGAPGLPNLFDYVSNITPASISVGGGAINLTYFESYDDVINGPDAFFNSIGSPAAGAFISITYMVPPIPINWYTSPIGGASIGTGSPFNPVGVAGSGLPNTNTIGTTIFYAGCSNGGCRTPALFTIAADCGSINAIAGTVFNDINDNGVKDASETAGLPGIKVIAVNANGVKIDSATTNIYGSYNFPNIRPSDGPVMLQFLQSSFPSAFVVSKAGPDNKTDLQVTTAPNCNANMGMTITGFGTSNCSNNPDVVVTKFQPGDATAGDVLVKFPYNNSGTSPLPLSLNSPGTLLGAVWGLAYQANSNKVFSAACMRRHTAFGTGGTGAIYVTDVASNTSSLYLNLNSFAGINLGSDPHYYTDLLQDRIVGLNNPFDAVGKISFGDIDFSTDGKYLFAVNLNQRTIHKIFTNNPAVAGTTITAADITTFNIPNPGCTGGTYRPWGLKYFNNKLYIGVVCDGSVGALGAGANQFAYVYEMDPNTGAATQALTFPLNYKKGLAKAITVVQIPNDARWNNWISDWTSCSPAPGDGGAIAYPQPILSDIEIDVNGDMIVSFIDRFGMQGATGVQDPHGSNSPDENCAPNKSTYVFIASGDILRAGKCTPTTWIIESNGSQCGLPGTAGANNGQGPGTVPNNGEFYYQENYGIHLETSLGGLALVPGKGEVLLNVYDPLASNTGGTAKFNNSNGTRVSSYEIIPVGVNNYFGNSNSLGDVEVLCDQRSIDPQPIKIGNRIWIDVDRDGVQDPNESNGPGVAISLWKSGTQIATITTDANGQFYFSSISGGNGVVWTGTGADTALLPNTAYEIRMDMTQHILGNYELTAANSTLNVGDDQNDSDATRLVNNAIVAVTTGGGGSTNYTLDIGVRRTGLLPISFINIGAARQGQAIAITWQVGTETDISHYIVEKSTNGINFVALGSVTANKSNPYKLLDPSPTNGRNYYRVKAVELNNNSKYSNTISVLNTGKAPVQILPNPAKDNVTISGLNGKATITIFSIDGKVMHKRITNAFTLSESIDLKDFASGKYFVQIVTDAGIESKQFQVIK